MGTITKSLPHKWFSNQARILKGSPYGYLTVNCHLSHTHTHAAGGNCDKVACVKRIIFMTSIIKLLAKYQLKEKARKDP
jgi:hypothetical protein